MSEGSRKTGSQVRLPGEHFVPAGYLLTALVCGTVGLFAAGIVWAIGPLALFAMAVFHLGRIADAAEEIAFTNNPASTMSSTSENRPTHEHYGS